MNAPRKPEGQYHHGGLRDALLEAAIRVIEREGLAALTLRRIARETGVSAAAPYAHFRDKRSLLAAVCVAGYERFVARMAEEAAGCDGGARVAALGRGYIHFALENPGLFNLMNSGRLSELVAADETVPAAFASGYQMLVEAIEKAPLSHLGAPHPELDVPLAWSVVHGIACLLLDGRISPERYGFRDLDALIDALIRRFVGLEAEAR